jgi:hypothetical protein
MIRVQIQDKGVVAYADECLFDECNGVSATVPLALSIVGPEQSVKAIRHACGLSLDRRPSLIIGNRNPISVRWIYRAQAQSAKLAPGVMHCVMTATNIPLVTSYKRSDEEAASDAEMASLVFMHDGMSEKEAVYRALRQTRSTPLMPLDSLVEAESACASNWVRTIGSVICRKNQNTWRLATPHPELTDSRWRAGLLKISTADLDKVVSTLMASGSLTFPSTEALAHAG